MAIIRAPRVEENFYVLDKSISEDISLSWAARGMLIFLLGKPNNWQVSVQHLINQTTECRTKSGRDAVRALLKEISDAGYMERRPVTGDDGKFAGFDYLISEKKRRADQPATASPAAVQPLAANPPLTSIDVLTSIEEKQTTISKRAKKDYSTQFEIVWKTYPNKSNKANSLKAFEKLNPDDELISKIMKAIEVQKQTPQWTDSNGRFIPNMQAWLNGRRWEDEVSSLAKNTQGGGMGGWI